MKSPLLCFTQITTKSLFMLSKNLINYSIKLLLKEKNDYLFSFFIFTFIVCILSSVLFISDSIKYDLLSTLGEKDKIILTNTKSGRYAPLNENHIDQIIQFNGIEDVVGKVDGYYNFLQDRRYIHVVCDDTIDDENMVISKDVEKLFKKFHYEKEFNFLTIDGILTKSIKKIVPSNIISNNTIFVNSDVAREILQMSDDEYSYISVSVPNENEVDFIARKIVDLFPHVKAQTKSDIESDFRHIFYYKGGIFMIVYIVAMLSFFILLKHQVSSSYGSKKREIAILRSVGFAIKDIILVKFIQHSVVAISSFVVGLFFAYFFIFILNAPFLKNIFLGENMSHIIFTPILDFRMIFLIFLFTVVPFLAFILIPAWRISIDDLSGVLK